MSRAAVSAAQTLLVDKGQRIAVDGMWGPKTETGFRSVDEASRDEISRVVASLGADLDSIRARFIKRPRTIAGFDSVVASARAAGIEGEELFLFVGTVGGESAFRYNAIENGAYRSVAQLRGAMGANPVVSRATNSFLAQLVGRGPAAIFSYAYGGRNGNDEPSDGWLFRGRGYIQLTWKANYRACGDAIGVDLVKDPDFVIRSHENSFKTALWYWRTRVKYRVGMTMADVTRLVKGGAPSEEVARRSQFAELVRTA